MGSVLGVEIAVDVHMASTGSTEVGVDSQCFAPIHLLGRRPAVVDLCPPDVPEDARHQYCAAGHIQVCLSTGDFLAPALCCQCHLGVDVNVVPHADVCGPKLLSAALLPMDSASHKIC